MCGAGDRRENFYGKLQCKYSTAYFDSCLSTLYLVPCIYSRHSTLFSHPGLEQRFCNLPGTVQVNSTEYGTTKIDKQQ